MAILGSVIMSLMFTAGVFTARVSSMLSGLILNVSVNLRDVTSMLSRLLLGVSVRMRSGSLAIWVVCGPWVNVTSMLVSVLFLWIGSFLTGILSRWNYYIRSSRDGDSDVTSHDWLVLLASPSLEHPRLHLHGLQGRFAFLSGSDENDLATSNANVVVRAVTILVLLGDVKDGSGGFLVDGPFVTSAQVLVKDELSSLTNLKLDATGLELSLGISDSQVELLVSCVLLSLGLVSVLFMSMSIWVRVLRLDWSGRIRASFWLLVSVVGPGVGWLMTGLWCMLFVWVAGVLRFRRLVLLPGVSVLMSGVVVLRSGVVVLGSSRLVSTAMLRTTVAAAGSLGTTMAGTAVAGAAVTSATMA